MNTDHLVVGRECGECSVCCTTLRIEEPTLQKLADDPCVNLTAKGCKIYSTRPSVCRNWYCGWRFIPYLDDTWRPDQSGVLLRVNEHGGIVLQALEEPEQVLTQEPILLFVANAISNDVPTYLSLPRQPGYCHALVHLNDGMANAVAARQKDVVEAAMRGAIEHGATVSTDPIEPIRIIE